MFRCIERKLIKLLKKCKKQKGKTKVNKQRHKKKKINERSIGEEHNDKRRYKF